MSDDQVLIAAGLGDVYGGGLFALDRGAVRRIDAISTMGIAFDGGRFARNLRCMPESGVVGEIVVYDQGGVRQYLRLDDAGGVHDLAWDGDAIVVASTWHNAVRWFGLDGRMRKEVRYPGDYDASHLNCITRHDGIWYATIFSPLRAFREWDTPAREGSGRIVELETGRVVVDGLSAPHTPRRLDDLFLVCNSQAQELAVFDAATGAPVRRIDCGAWTRGIAIADDAIYVGGCRRRRKGAYDSPSFGEAEIIAIDRASWTVVERIPVGTQEIYELAFVSRTMLAGLERGFDVNAHRARESRQWSAFAELGVERPRSLFPTGDPLPWEDFHCTLAGTLPARWTVNEQREIPIRVENTSRSFFTSAPPAPVYASFKWTDAGTGAYVDDRRAHRTRLPRTLAPGGTYEVVVRVVAPSRPTRARLRVTLMQEGVTWFDDHDPAAVLEVAAVVEPAVSSDEPFVPVVDDAPQSAPSRVRPSTNGGANRTIYVAGNCMAGLVVRCLQLMNPAASIAYVPMRTDVRSVAAPGDLVVRQRLPHFPWMIRPFDGSETPFPRLPYNAFHPDCVVLPSRTRGVLNSFHSSLVLYGWHHELSVAQTVALFNEGVYERLGFFDYAPAADQVLLEEGAATGFPLGDLLASWRRSGCFMHIINHPKIHVIADLARELACRIELDVVMPDPESFLVDALQREGVWPVYPELAERWGLPRGSTTFMPAYDPAYAQAVPHVLDLEAFVALSFAGYAKVNRAQLALPRLESPLYRDLERLDGAAPPAASPTATARQTTATSPYAALPDERFWRRAIANVPATAVDPAASPSYTIETSTGILAIGSCFAQRLADAMLDAGYEILDPQCGNVYTARQLVQLFDRAFGSFAPADEAWQREDGRYVDPFRPQIEAAGFASADAVRAARDEQLAATRAAFAGAGVVVVTLGLTEAWFARADGAVFPLAPGVAGGVADPVRYGFHNASTAEIVADLHAFVERLRAVNRNAQVVLTVSPQPPIATYETRHILMSATYTKAALRAAVDEIERAHANVTYFPGYEIVAGSFNRGMYYEADLRSVNAAGVDRVMRLFFAHYARSDERRDAVDALVLAEGRAIADVLCDEELLDAVG